MRKEDRGESPHTVHIICQCGHWRVGIFFEKEHRQDLIQSLLNNYQKTQKSRAYNGSQIIRSKHHKDSDASSHIRILVGDVP